MGLRIHEASKKYNLSNKDMADLLVHLGYQGKTNPLAGLPEEMLEVLDKHFSSQKGGQGVKPAPIPAPTAEQSQPAKAKTDLPKPAPQPAVQQQPAPKPAVTVSPVPVTVEKTQPVSEKKSHDERSEKDLQLEKNKLDKKKIGPKPLRIEEEEEVEVNKQITIIKTASPKKETQAPIKKKSVKNKTKRAHFSKKVQAEMREAERQTEAILDRTGKSENFEEDEDTLPKILVPTDITVSQLAKYLEVDAVAIVKKLFGIGVIASLNQRLEIEQMQLIGQEFGKDIVFTENVFEIEDTPDSEGDLRTRPPVVTIMGHVDHGKTSLLDAIRQTNVSDGETGGITQAIGAYHVHVNGRDIVFLDTPGHEAFTAMRARGAQVTDIVVLIVAADDGVMNQTVEAINHARVAGVPIIVAINKIDKPGADPEKIKQALTEHNLLSEQWGGDTIFCEVSAKKKINIEELLEMILLQADVMELKADPDRPVRGIIIESKLDKGRGPVATVLIQEGTLRESDSFVSKTEFGRVRALINDQGRRIKEAGPSMPVEVIGFSSVPQTGAEFFCVDDEKKARAIADYWTRKAREKELSSLSKITLEQLYQRIKEGAKEFNVIVKADVQGSIEAISDALNKLSTDDIKLKIIHSSTGAISETDVMLASASQAIIIGFNVRPDARVVDVAQREGVEIKLYDIIYNVIADVRAAMEGLLEPEYREVVQGRAEVRELFKVPKVGTIAGCYVTDGKIMRSNNLKLVRDSVVVFDGKILSLKRFKDDAREVLAGFECGIGIEGFNDIHPGDVIEAYAIETLEKKLEPNADKR